MKEFVKYLTITIISLFFLIGCDPFHNIRLENSTSEEIEVLIPENYFFDEETEFEEVKFKGRKLGLTKLQPNEFINIGSVVANYKPKKEDIGIDFLELRISSRDTITFIGKTAIYSQLRKIDKLDWRIQVK